MHPHRHLILVLFFTITCALLPGQNYAEEQPPDKEKVITLEQAVEMALAQNRSLQSAGLDVASSQYALEAQKGEFDIKVRPIGRLGQSSADNRTWNVGVDFSKKLESNVTVSLRPTMGGSENENVTGLALSLGVPLLRGFGKDAGLDGVYSSLYSLNTAKLSFYRTQVDTVMRTVRAVYDAIQSEQLVTFYAEQEKRLAGHLALVKIKVQSGVISAIDLYRAEIQLKNVQDALASAQERETDNIDVLKEILAMPMQKAITITAPVEYEPVDIPLEQAQETARQNRVEIEMQHMALDEAERKEKLARHNLLPDVNLNMAYSPEGRASESFDFTSLNDQNWYMQLSGNTDFSQAAEKSAYERSRIAMRQAKIDYEASLDSIEKEVRSQLNRLEKNQQRIDLRKEQIRQANGKLKLAQSKFRYNMAGNFDLLEAQTEFQKAQTDYLADVMSYIIGTYQLRATISTLFARE